MTPRKEDRSSCLYVGGVVTRLAIALQGQAKKVYAISLAGSMALDDFKWARGIS